MKVGTNGGNIMQAGDHVANNATNDWVFAEYISAAGKSLGRSTAVPERSITRRGGWRRVGGLRVGQTLIFTNKQRQDLGRKISRSRTSADFLLFRRPSVLAVFENCKTVKARLKYNAS